MDYEVVRDLAAPLVEWIERSCCRCGVKFRAASEREHVCQSCRGPQRPSRVLPTPGALLSPRERQIAELVARGWPNKAIARGLHLSQETVKVYLYHMFRKAGVSNRTELALVAQKTAQEFK